MLSGVNMTVNVDEIILQALKEDLPMEDITTCSVLREKKQAKVQLLAKEQGIIAGLEVFERVFILLGNVVFNKYVRDGESVASGQVIGELVGDAEVILSGERTALNYLQRMSGIATFTKTLSQELEGSHTKLLDTRKTTPGMRVFEKYAVKVGGGHNHRSNLSDGILLKDNHIQAAGGVKAAITLAKEYASFVRKIEVEVENLEMVAEALEAGADIIMLDNMTDEEVSKAIGMINGKALTECSGNINKDRIRTLKALKVDYISCGALTHSAPILDLSLKNLVIL